MSGFSVLTFSRILSATARGPVCVPQGRISTSFPWKWPRKRVSRLVKVTCSNCGGLGEVDNTSSVVKSWRGVNDGGMHALKEIQEEGAVETCLTCEGRKYVLVRVWEDAP
jgi:hypothetical protein